MTPTPIANATTPITEQTSFESHALASAQPLTYSPTASSTPDPGQDILGQLGDLELSSMKLIAPLKKLASEIPCIGSIILGIEQSPAQDDFVFQDLGTLLDLQRMQEELDELSTFPGYLANAKSSHSSLVCEKARNLLNQKAIKENDPLDLGTALPRLKEWMITRLESYSQKLSSAPSDADKVRESLCYRQVAIRILNTKQGGWEKPDFHEPPEELEVLEDAGPGDELIKDLSKLEDDWDYVYELNAMVKPRRYCNSQRVAYRLDRNRLDRTFSKNFLANQSAIRGFLVSSRAVHASYYFRRLERKEVAKTHFKDLEQWKDWKNEKEQQLLVKIIKAMVIAVKSNPSCAHVFSALLSTFERDDIINILPDLNASEIYTMIAPEPVPSFENCPNTKGWSSLNHQFRMIEINALMRHMPGDTSEEAFRNFESFASRFTTKFQEIYPNFQDKNYSIQFIIQALEFVLLSKSIDFSRRSNCITDLFMQCIDKYTKINEGFYIELFRRLEDDNFSLIWSALNDLECDQIIDDWSDNPEYAPSLSTLLKTSVDERVSIQSTATILLFLAQNHPKANIFYLVNEIFCIPEHRCRELIKSRDPEDATKLLSILEAHRDFKEKLTSNSKIQGSTAAQLMETILKLPVSRYQNDENFELLKKTAR